MSERVLARSDISHLAFLSNTDKFCAGSELHFALPVEIGSLLRLDSRVTFSPIRGECL